jgi:hypothetical protein
MSPRTLTDEAFLFFVAFFRFVNRAAGRLDVRPA